MCLGTVRPPVTTVQWSSASCSLEAMIPAVCSAQRACASDRQVTSLYRSEKGVLYWLCFEWISHAGGNCTTLRQLSPKRWQAKQELLHCLLPKNCTVSCRSTHHNISGTLHSQYILISTTDVFTITYYVNFHC